MYDKNDELIDEAILIYFKSPKSFTGEDVVEFQCHGGVTVANMILDEVLSHGVRLANPGEFSKRAFLNGRIDLTEAEAIAKLIETKSVDAAKILSKQMKGELKDFIEGIRDSLVELLGFVEVNIDYAEEDLPEDLESRMILKLKDIASILEKSVQKSKSREGLINGFKVSIVGKPNVGKSSLLNSLLSCNRAIISDIAGTTRDTIEEEIKIGTHLIKIIDTAGIRESSDTIEKIGIQRSVSSIEESEIVLAMFDGSKSADEDDKKMIDLLEDYKDEKEIIILLNKSDLEQRFDKKTLLEYSLIELSCKEDTSVVIQKIKEFLDIQNLENEVMLTSKRQIDGVIKAHDLISSSKDLLQGGELELFAYNINAAIEHISSITRAFQRDEILDKMFGSFCLGK